MSILITDSATYQIQLENQVLYISLQFWKQTEEGSVSVHLIQTQTPSKNRAELKGLLPIQWIHKHTCESCSLVCVKSPPWRRCSLHPVTPLPSLFSPRKWRAEDRNSLLHTHIHRNPQKWMDCMIAHRYQWWHHPLPSRCLLGLILKREWQGLLFM